MSGFQAPYILSFGAVKATLGGKLVACKPCRGGADEGEGAGSESWPGGKKMHPGDLSFLKEGRKEGRKL